MTIRTEIMRVDNTPEPLASEIGRRNREIFPDVGPDAIDTRGIQWTPGEWCVVVYNNDEFGAYAEVLQREILVGGQPVTVGGIGGVMSLPHMRGLGLGKAAMRALTDYICTEMNADAGMLYCAPHNVAYYQSLGWHHITRQITYHQYDGTHVIDMRGGTDDNALVLPCGDFVFPTGDIDIRGQLW
ncbi:MAG: GNAT family N-acetyltransferase [Chloroflexota bacterium]